MESNHSGFNPKIHHRRSIRLKGYDYSRAGMYFITICCQNKICRFGKIVVIGSDHNSMEEQPGRPQETGRPQGYAPTGIQLTGIQLTGIQLTDLQPTIAQSEIQIMKLNDAGKMVDEQWLAMVNRFPNIELHEYIIMPNHFHCILEIVETSVGVPLVGTQSNNTEIMEEGRPRGFAPTFAPTSTPTSAPKDTSMADSQNDNFKPKNKTIGDMMDAFKSIITVEYIRGVKNKGWDRFDGKLLQRDYYEHIIRNEQEYQRISEYIVNNPSKWKGDKFYSE